MTLLWIPFTLMAAFMQAWRNATQKQLSQYASTLGVTLARFIVALPFSVIYLWALYQYYADVKIPIFTSKFFLCCVTAGVAQIFATVFMVMLFKARNYTIGVGLAKSEAILTAILGALFFSVSLSRLAWVGVFIGLIAVWLMSLSRGTSSSLRDLSVKTILTGLASGLCFAICSMFIRQSSLALREMNELPVLLSAAWTLLFILSIQTVLLVLWLGFKDPQTLKTLYEKRKLTTTVSFFSFSASLCWFTAMSLQVVPMVKTLGQVEVLFTLGISAWWFKEKLNPNDYLGLILIMISAILVVLA